jgi:hypothetical protein
MRIESLRATFFSGIFAKLQIFMMSVFLSLTLSAASAQDPLTVGASLAILQDKIFDNIDNSIDQAFNRFDNSVSKIRSHAEGVMDSAKNDLSAIMDKSIQELTEQEREIWRYYESTLQKLDDRVTAYLRDGNITLLNVGNVTSSQNPFDDEIPVIFWVEIDPPLYVHKAPSRRISAYGLNLDNVSNSLLVNTVAARRASASPTELAFIVENSDFSSGTKLEFFLYESRFLSFLSNWFDREYLSSFEFAAVEDYVGEIRLVYHTDSYPEIERVWPTASPKTASCRNNTAGTNNCETGWGREVVQATQGFSIVPESVRVETGSSGCRGNTVSIGFSEVSGNSFAIFGGAQANSGSRRVCSISGRYFWRERRDVPDKIENFGESVLFLRSNRGVSLTLPSSGASAIAVEFKPTGADVFERIAIPTDRWPLKFNAQAGTGVVEVTW